MSNNEFSDTDLRDARRRVPRSRGATSGLLLLILGLWGALIPLLGPIVHFGFAPDKTFKFTAARFWLEILPGAVVVVGALVLMGLASRVVASLGAWLCVAGGAWFVIGNNLASLLHLGTLGLPLQKTKLGRALDGLLLFDALGALIVFLGALALGRLAVVGVRDVRAARRRNTDDRHDDNDDDDDRPTPRRTEQVTTRVEPVPPVPTTPVPTTPVPTTPVPTTPVRTTTVVEADNTTDTSGPSHDDHRGKGSGSTRL